MILIGFDISHIRPILHVHIYVYMYMYTWRYIKSCVWRCVDISRCEFYCHYYKYIAIISSNSGSLIAITIYHGLDSLRARSKCRSISTRLFWRTAAATRAALRETSISNWSYPSPRGDSHHRRDPTISPSYLLETCLPCSSRARTILELGKFYYYPEGITARQ